MWRPEEEDGVGEIASQVRWRELTLSSAPIPSPTAIPRPWRSSEDEFAIPRSGASVNVDSRPPQ